MNISLSSWDFGKLAIIKCSWKSAPCILHTSCYGNCFSMLWNVVSNVQNIIFKRCKYNHGLSVWLLLAFVQVLILVPADKYSGMINLATYFQMWHPFPTTPKLIVSLTDAAQRWVQNLSSIDRN